MPMETIISDEQSLAETGFYWRERDGVKVLVSRPLEDAGFANGFSTRLGGVSSFPENSLNLAGFDEDTAENIVENRRRFLNVFEGNYKLTSTWQVHGDDVKIVATGQDAESTEEKFDALVSDLPGILIGVKTADCVPVLIGDAEKSCLCRSSRGLAGNLAVYCTSCCRKNAEGVQQRPDGSCLRHRAGCPVRPI